MSPQAGKKTSLLILLAICLALQSGCYQDPIRAKLAGNWKIEHGDRLSRRVNEEDSEGVEDPSGRMVLSFTASGSLQTQTRIGGAIREKNGSWNAIEFDEEESVMKIQCKLMGQQTEHEVRFLEDDLIQLVPPNMAGTKSELTFRRH